MNGERIVVTRASHQSQNLARLLRESGGHPIELPVISIESVPVTPPLMNTLNALDRNDWIAFTSANAVHYFFAELSGALQATPCLIAAVGSATVAALHNNGWRADVVADEASATGLADAMEAAGVAQRTVLLPQAAAARPELARHLADAGARVIPLIMYRTVVPEDLRKNLVAMWNGPTPDAISLASPSAAEYLVQAAQEASIDLSALPTFVIGPTTARAARDHGYHVVATADAPTDLSLAQTIVRHFTKGKVP